MYCLQAEHYHQAEHYRQAERSRSLTVSLNIYVFVKKFAILGYALHNQR